MTETSLRQPKVRPSIEVRVDKDRGIVQKIAWDDAGRHRLRRESLFLSRLEAVEGVPSLTKAPSDRRIEMQLVAGQSLGDWLELNDRWQGVARPLAEVLHRLKQYAALDMRLLARGVLYRDLNPSHILWGEQSVSLIDFEASSLLAEDGAGRVESRRGTYETMAPEEFINYASVSQRTATYRLAILAHLALTGTLPFTSNLSRRKALSWRRKYRARVSRDLPIPVARVIRHALSIEPAHRHADPDSFLSALTEAYEK